MTVDPKNLLPSADGNYDKIKEVKSELPYSILLKYAKIVSEKYPSKLEGVVIETSGTSKEQLLSYALYFLASIGKGFTFRLLEIEPLTNNIYPVKVRLANDYPKKYKKINNSTELEETLNEIYSNSYTHSLIYNLLAQVDLYNESRNE